MHTLVTIKNKDYGDEYTLAGFRIFEPAEWLTFKQNVENNKYPLEIYWGSNESCIFESAEDVMGLFDVTLIADYELAMIKKLFFKHDSQVDFGFFPDRAGELG